VLVTLGVGVGVALTCVLGVAVAVVQSCEYRRETESLFPPQVTSICSAPQLWYPREELCTPVFTGSVTVGSSFCLDT
jgi:hypothetical protein